MSNTVQIQWYNLALTGTSSCLSIIGGAVIIFTYVKISSIRNYTRTLLLYLTFADLLTATGNLVATVRYAVVHDLAGNIGIHSPNCSYVYGASSRENTTDDDRKYDIYDVFQDIPEDGTIYRIMVEETGDTEYEKVCKGQSFVTTFSNLSSFLWTTIIAFHIWFSIMMRSRKTETTCSHVIFHFIGWVLPAGVVTPFLVQGYLGEDTCYGTGVWCGIRSGMSRDVVRTLMYTADIGWQLSCYLLTTFFCVTIKFNLWIKQIYGNIEDLRSISANLRNEDRNFIKIVLIIYSLKIWGIIRFFITIYSTEDTLQNSIPMSKVLTFLLIMQSYGASGQAFWNFVLFCLGDDVVRLKLKECILCKRYTETVT